MKTRRSVRFLVTLSAFLTLSFLAFFYRIDNVLINAKNLAVVANLTATKTGALDTGGDANGNGIVNPGDRLRYTVVINDSGTDATGVNFSDTIDANTTYVTNSVIASPVAVNDAYTSIGNVGINVPAASGVLVNDLNANTAALCSVGNTCTITTTGSFTSGNGGSGTLNSDGSFTYNPPVGFEGVDTFSYTISNGTGLTNPATVSITVSEVIWFVNANAGSNGNGTLNSPFNSLPNFNAGAADDPDDVIFLYESGNAYTGGITLLTGQKLIGQDSTATLAASAGITVPPFSNDLPATNSGNATITNLTGTTTLNTNAILRGFSVNSTTSTGINDPAGAITGVTTSEVNVTTTTGTAILLSSTGGTLSFIKVSANGATNGISLTNTTGSFTVIGDGSNTTVGGNNTGGDIDSAGTGVSLNNAQNVTLRRMRIHDNPDFGIYGTNVTGFTLEYSTVDGVNGDNAGLDEGSVIFGFVAPATSGAGLYGTSSIKSSVIKGSVEDNLRVRDTDGTLNLTVDSCTFNNAPNDNIIIEPSVTANVTAHITNNTFVGAGGDHFQTATSNTATLNVVFTGNFYSNGFAGSLGGGITISGGNLGSNETVNFNISNNGSAANPLVGTIQGGALNINKGGGGGTWQGQVSNNFIGNAAVAGSGASQSSGIRVENHSPTGTMTAIISGNIIRQWGNGAAINTQGGDAGNATNNGVINLTVTNNTATNPGAFAQHGFVANIGASGLVGDTYTACTDVSSNTLDGNSAQSGSGIRLRQRGSSTIRIPGYTGTQYDTLAVISFETTKNPASTPAPTATSSGTGPGFVNTPGGAQCTQPTVPAFAVVNKKIVDTTTNNLDNNLSFLNSSYQSPSELLAGIQPLFKDSTIVSNEETVKNETASEIVEASGTSYLTSIRKTARQIYDGLSEAISPTAYAAGETVTKSLGNLPAGESITVQFTATVNSTPATFFSVSNTASISGTNFTTFNSTTAINTIVQPPSISAAFGAAFVNVNGTTTLTFTVNNPNAQTLNGISFSNTLSSGLVIATPNGVTNTCGGTVTALAGGSTISLSGGSRAANSSCTVKVDVRGTTEGVKNISAGTSVAVASTEGGTGNTATATITVINPPTLAKSFTPNQIQLGGTSNLQFTFSNPNTTLALNTLAFTDPLPAGVTAPDTAATTVCTDGSYTITSNVISFTKPTLAAGTNCVFSVTVTGATAGLKTNTTSTVTTANSNAGTAATATLTVVAPPTISKAFSPTSFVSGGTSTVTLTLSNSNTTGALTNASFTDALVNMNAVGGAVGGTCAGTTPNTLAAGATNLSFSGITIPNNASCTVTFAVTSTSVGTNPNTTSGVATNQTPVAGTPSNTANLTVIAPADLTITKTHTGNFTQGDTGKTYSITVTNSGGTSTSGTVTVTDTLPTGLTATAISGTNWTCALGTLTCTRSDALAAGSSYPAITLTVNVANNAPSSVTNTATVSGGGETNTANDTANDATTINAAATYTISGQVTNGGAGLEGVLVTLSGTPSSSTTTDASGNYSFSNLTGGGNYTVTPSLNGYTFNPASAPVNNLTSNQTGINFATTVASYEADAAPRPAGDGDGTVNGGDITVIRKFVAGIETPSAPANGSEFQRVDNAPLYDANNVLVKGDGAIKGGDITQVRRYAAGLDAVQPAGGPAAPIPPPSALTNNLNSAESLLAAPNLVAAAPRDVRPVKISLVGNVLTVAVNLNTDPGDTAANTVDFTLLYDTGVLSNPTNIRLGANAPGVTTITPNTAQSGKVGIVLDLPVLGATTTFPTGDAQLVLIDFTVAAMPPATTMLSFGNLPVAEFVGDINGNRLTPTTFSPATIAILAPTAASVTVEGRAMTQNGRGIGNVTISMTDLQGNVTTARTNPFGYYRFYNIAAGETIILTARGKRYTFSQPSQVLNVNEDTFDINFIGSETRRLVLE